MKWEVVRSIVMKENIVQKLTSKDDKYALPLLIELLQKAMIQMNGMNTLRMLPD